MFDGNMLPSILLVKDNTIREDKLDRVSRIPLDRLFCPRDNSTMFGICQTSLGMLPFS